MSRTGDGLQVLSPLDRDEIRDFIDQRQATANPDPFERMLQSWSSRTRTEALQHYLGLGWSFVSRKQGRVDGLVLAQPVLFFRGMTQTLWVEWLDALTSETASALADATVRIAREKHLQRVHFDPQSLAVEGAFEAWSQRVLSPALVEIKTTKDQS